MKLILATALLALFCVTDADAARLIVRQRPAAFRAPVRFAGPQVNVNVNGGQAFVARPAAFRFRRTAFVAQPYVYNQNLVAQQQAFRYRQNFVAPIQAYSYGMQQNLAAPQQAFSCQQALTTGGCQQQNFVGPQQAYSYQQQNVVAPQPCQQSFQYQQEVVPQPCPQNLVSPQVGGTCNTGAAFSAGYGAMGYGGAALVGGNVHHHHNHFSLFGGRRSFR